MFFLILRNLLAFILLLIKFLLSIVKLNTVWFDDFLNKFVLYFSVVAAVFLFVFQGW